MSRMVGTDDEKKKDIQCPESSDKRRLRGNEYFIEEIEAALKLIKTGDERNKLLKELKERKKENEELIDKAYGLKKE